MNLRPSGLLPDGRKAMLKLDYMTMGDGVYADGELILTNMFIYIADMKRPLPPAGFEVLESPSCALSIKFRKFF